ncbi:MAG: hypothetical protein KIS92_07100 [Planctomycetota bacterium]|nr:hypothetical protein [Planctomycetota bacterium]
MKTSTWLLAILLAAGLAVAGASPVRAAEHGKGKGKDKEKKDEEGKDGKEGKEGKEGKDAAKGEHGKGHADKAKDEPGGWDKGKKTGWKDEYPPGWDKKSDDEKAKWHADLEDAKKAVGKACDEKKMKDDEKTQMQEALERIARKGKKIEACKEETVGAIQKAKSAFEVLKENGIVLETGQ